MRNLHALDQYRLNLSSYFGSVGDAKNGAFAMLINKKQYFAIASAEIGWDHVSVSTKNQVPSLTIMEVFKKIFFKENEIVVEYHPKKSDYINNHPFCLHMWRPNEETLELPNSSAYDDDDPKNKVTGEKMKIRGNTVIVYKITSKEWEVLKIQARKTLDWATMCEIKTRMFGEDVAAIQIHSKDVVQDEKNMYIMRPLNHELLTPPVELVGDKDLNL